MPPRARTKPKKPKQRADMQHLDLMETTIENPLFSRAHTEGKEGNVRYIKATVNVRESAVSTLAARGLLNQAQVQAADKFRRLYEAMGGAGARAIDWRKEVVDGGRQVDPISDELLDAGNQLVDARDSLKAAYGSRGWTLVRDICGDGHSIHDLTATRRQRDTMTDILRDCLDHLAGLWGFASRRRK